MSGKLTCEKVAAQKEKLKNSQKTLDTLNNIATFGIANIELPKDDRAVNILNNNLKKIKETIVNNFCQNIQDVNQKNVFIQPASCYRAINKSCIENGVPDVDCVRSRYDFLDKYSNKAVTQDNRNTQRAECEINSIIGVLTEQEQNIDNLALIKLLQERASKTNDADNSCSEISANITQDKYIGSFLGCSNKSVVKQQNIIKEDCFPLITSQQNINQDITKCLNTSGIFDKDIINIPNVSNIVSVNTNPNKNLPTQNDSPINISSLNIGISETASIIVGAIITFFIVVISGYFIFKKRTN